MNVRIVPSTPGAPAGKLAEAEIYFDESAGPLSGLEACRIHRVGRARLEHATERHVSLLASTR